MKKLIISLIVITVGLGSFFYFSTPKNLDANGFVTIEVIDEDGMLVSSKDIEFSEDSTLFELLNENYLLTCANSAYQPTNVCGKITMNGRVILGVDDVVTDWNNSFLGIYINEEYSVYGIDGIALEENAVYRFEYTIIGGGTQ